MAPSLADVDLRDYFWVARDKLATTFSGLSLVPPAVRRAFEDLISSNAGLRAAAANFAGECDDADRAALLELLAAQLSKHPAQKAGYDAFRALVEREIVGAAAAFGTAALQVPTARVPAAVGADLRSLVGTRNELTATLGAVLEQWERAPDTIVGRALRPQGGGSVGPVGSPRDSTRR